MREHSEPRAGSMWWFFGKSLRFIVYNLKYEGALGTKSSFDVVVLWKESKFLGIESEI